MLFINYNFNFTTHTVFGAGLLVKDALTLTFSDDETGKIFTTTAIINYSAMGYGRMTIQPHKRLDDRMLDKHYKYMGDVDIYRKDTVKPVLNALLCSEFKSVNQFIKTYNKRAYINY